MQVVRKFSLRGLALSVAAFGSVNFPTRNARSELLSDTNLSAFQGDQQLKTGGLPMPVRADLDGFGSQQTLLANPAG